MIGRLALVGLAAGAAFVTAAPAHAESVCVSHDLRPTVNAAGVFCVDTNDPDVIACYGTIRNTMYMCA